MAYYQGNTKGNIFRGYYRPLNRYAGKTKLIGWEYTEKSGEVLTIHNTYNDECDLEIIGLSTEIGAGTKSPTNPYTIKSVDNFELNISGETDVVSIDFPYTLRSVSSQVKCTIIRHKVYNANYFKIDCLFSKR
jgi:hypothetical protein